MKKPDRSNGSRGLTRREFIAGVAAAAGGLALPGCEQSSSVGGALPSPQDTGIDHIVVVMMENRSFDHYLGWVPGADGIQSGVSLKDSSGKAYSSYNLAPQFQNADMADPDHSYAGGRTEINKGKMDGFLLPQPAGDTFPIGYYTADSLPFFKGCADNWTICDRYFCSILSSTTPNRIYMHAGQTDRISNTVDVSTLPTVWDGMLAAGRKVAYYYTDVPYTAFWGSKYQSFSKKYDMASFAADIASGQLADLTYVDNVGNTLNEGTGVSMDDHPYADIRNGQAFLNAVYDALRQGPNWERTLVVVNYDEWGGFYDHVPPPLAPITSAEKVAGNDGRLGCRVPCVLIGPRARRGHVEHAQFDHNSVLNMIAWRFGFAPLGVRASSGNIAEALDFSSPPNLSAPAFVVPKGPFGQQCIPASEAAELGIPVPPGLPVVCLPAPVAVTTPPIPGLDVPVPGKSLDETARRRAEHEQELDGLRALASQHGFQ
ncbi:MAG: alkaline phosphatase family protein [Stenotrophobium sp.]